MATDPLSPVTAIISGRMNESANRRLARQTHGYNKEYMALSHMYEMASARKSAQMTKQGLIAAGLSPALMSQGIFAPATAPTSPSAAAPGYSPYHLESSGIGDLISLSNLQAQTENIKANTEGQKLKNEQTKDENLTAQSLAIMQLEKMASDLPDSAIEQKARLQAMADLAKNRGSLAALSEFSSMLDKSESYNSRLIQNRLQKAVTDYQLDEKHGKDGHSIIADIAELPSMQFSQLWNSSLDLLRHAEWLERQKGLSEEEKNLKLEEIKLTREQIANLKEVTQRIKDTNLMKIADDVGNGKESPWKLLAAISFLLFSNTSISFK